MIDNEKDLWKHMESLWLKPITIDVGSKGETHPTTAILPNSDTDAVFGLCRTLVRLHESKAVDYRTYYSGRIRLDAYLKRANWTGGYLFDLTPDGAKKRAIVCRQFADCAAKEAAATK